jgi:hypothetical protein
VEVENNLLSISEKKEEQKEESSKVDTTKKNLIIKHSEDL